MVNFWKLVNKVIKEADILLLVLDSRMPELTRNRELEQKIGSKKLIYVLNKCDLIHKDEMEEVARKYSPSVFVSSREKLGGTLLFRKIMELSRGEPCIVGVIGYPNVGKSSVINLLKGKKSASISPQSGHTRGIQFISAKGKIKLIDTPGVLEFSEKEIMKQIMIGSKNPQHVKEPDYYAAKLIEQFPKMFEKHCGLEYAGDPYDFLEKFALKSNTLVKGGNPDMNRIGRMLLQDWQKGKVHEKFLEN